MEEEARTQEDGKLTGPHYQKLPRHAMNSSSVGARRGAARENANVPRHHFSVLRHCGGFCSHNEQTPCLPI